MLGGRVPRSAMRCHRALKISSSGRHRTFFVEALSALPSATQGIQDALVSMKETSGMSWVGVFACSTLVVRTSLLPFVRFAMLENKKLAKAMPELNFLVQLLRERLNTSGSTGTSGASRSDEIKNTLSVFNKGVKACFTLHDVSLTRIILPPILNIGMFITFVVSVREMVRGGGVPDMDTGGMLWFENLAIADPTYALPLIAIGSSYSALEFGFSNPSERNISDPNKGGRLQVTIKDIFQTLLIVSVPFVTQLPAGIFAYWIPSSLAGMVQTQGLRTLAARERMQEEQEGEKHKAVLRVKDEESRRNNAVRDSDSA